MKCLAYFSQLRAAEKPVFPSIVCKGVVIFTDARRIFSLLGGGSLLAIGDVGHKATSTSTLLREVNIEPGDGMDKWGCRVSGF